MPLTTGKHHQKRWKALLILFKVMLLPEVDSFSSNQYAIKRQSQHHKRYQHHDDSNNNSNNFCRRDTGGNGGVLILGNKSRCPTNLQSKKRRKSVHLSLQPSSFASPSNDEKNDAITTTTLMADDDHNTSNGSNADVERSEGDSDSSSSSFSMKQSRPKIKLQKQTHQNSDRPQKSDSREEINVEEHSSKYAAASTMLEDGESSSSSPNYMNKNYDESKKRDMSYLIQSTQSLLLPENNGGIPVGSMSRKHLHRAYDTMKSWSKRSSIKQTKSKRDRGTRNEDSNIDSVTTNNETSTNNGNNGAPLVVERILNRLIKEENAKFEQWKQDQQNIAAIIDDNVDDNQPFQHIVTTNTYNILIDAWANSNNVESSSTNDGSITGPSISGMNAVQKCEDIVSFMEKESKDKNKLHLTPNDSTYNGLIKAWVKNGPSRDVSIDKVESIISKMIDLTKERKQLQQREEEATGESALSKYGVRGPNRRSYNLLLYALANTRPPPPPSPIATPAATAAAGDSSSSSPDYGSNTFAPGVNSYEIAANRAEEIIEHMEDMYDKTHNELIKPDINSYNQLLSALTRCSSSSNSDDNYSENTDEDGGDNDGDDESLFLYEFKAQEIFDRLIHDATNSFSNNHVVVPNTDTFNAIMGCWLKSLSAKTGKSRSSSSTDANILGLERIVDILELMDNLYASGIIEARPDAVTVNTMKAAYNTVQKNCKIMKYNSNTNMTSDADGSNDDVRLLVYRAKELHEYIVKKYSIKQDVISNNILIDSWCKSGKADVPERIDNLVSSMEKSFIKNQMNSFSTNVEIMNYNMKPDAYTYSSFIDSYVKCRRYYKNPGLYADKILDRMWTLHNDHGGDKPTVSVYNAVINAHATSSPMMRSYGDNNTDKDGKGISAQSSSYHAIDRVEELLKEMEHNPLIPSPNRITYNTVLKALQNHSIGNNYSLRALQILNDMAARSASAKSKSEKMDLLPDSYTYTAIITIIGRSLNTNNKADMSLEILQRMISSYKAGNKAARPQVRSFNAALNACAFSFTSSSPIPATSATTKPSSKTTPTPTIREQKSNVLSTALSIMALLQKYGQPDDVTYAAMLRSCSNLIPKDEADKRDKFATNLFEKCCEAGCVTTKVLEQLRFAVTSPDVFVTLTGFDPTDDDDVFIYNNIPKHWTRRSRRCNERIIRTKEDHSDKEVDNSTNNFNVINNSRNQNSRTGRRQQNWSQQKLTFRAIPISNRK